MTDPRRLLDSSQNPALRSLLGSGLEDAPGANALPKVAAALGVATVTVAASSLSVAHLGAQAATSVKAVTVAGSAPTGAGALGFFGGGTFLGSNTMLALGKTLLVSMVSAGALSAGAVAVYESTSSRQPNAARVEHTAGKSASGPEQRAAHVRRQQQATEAVPALAEPAPAEAASTERAASTIAASRERAGARPDSDTTLPSGPVADVRERGSRSAPPPMKPAPSPAVAEPHALAEAPHASAKPDALEKSNGTGVLAREVRQIDSARQALESHDADAALAALDSYEQSRVVGVLDREAMLLKIEALTQKRDIEQAKALARHYVARFPTDAHAPRLRALLGTPPASGPSSPR